MDYQRACGCQLSRGMQGMGRSAWRAPYGGERVQNRSPMSRDADRDDGERECCEPLAIVTSPIQCWQNLYPACEAMSTGTLFRDLNLPLVGCNIATPYRKGGGV